MKNLDTFKSIASHYLAAYSLAAGLDRPLTDEQVKDAGVLMLDLLYAHEIGTTVAHGRCTERPDRSFGDIVDLAIAQQKHQFGITGPLNALQAESLAFLFLDYVRRSEGLARHGGNRA